MTRYIENILKSFAQSIENTELSEYEQTAKNISEKIAKKYYGNEVGYKKIVYIVGSVGRGTSIKNVSDLDFLLVLPSDIKKRFEAYAGNGQSALLQEIKAIIATRYPQTDIRGDGQVVVIDFHKYTVELVPAFEQLDGSFLYPDTHNKGRWKTTKPLEEIAACKKFNIETNGIFFDLCRMIRVWKQNQGVPLGGLLIDTIVYNFLKQTDLHNEYQVLIADLFYYISKIDKGRCYWNAIGSKQVVSMPSITSFITEAEKTYHRLYSCQNEKALCNTYRLIFGRSFTNQCLTLENILESGCRTEQFIENIFKLNIKNNLLIDCVVSEAKGKAKEKQLSEIIKRKEYITVGTNLDFYIVSTDCSEPYSIYWKIRNQGQEAIRRNMQRGQIVKTDSDTHHEEAVFSGNHYVECFLVNSNGICVARNKIDVPIHR